MTVIEVAVVMAILSVLAAIAVPNITEWMRHQRAKDSARGVGDLLLIARSEAIRTGRRQVVFFGPPGTVDPAGNPVEAHGDWVPVLRLDDGLPAAANCVIDAGEPIEGLPAAEGLSWGVTEASVRVPTDTGAGPFKVVGWNGATFVHATGGAVPWVVFDPDGMPLTFDGAGGDCGVFGGLGAGGGALYVTDGERDYAVVLSPIGGVRVHLWNPASGWSS